jgi:tetratricopeptide (TPR) repeat protein
MKRLRYKTLRELPMLMLRPLLMSIAVALGLSSTCASVAAERVLATQLQTKEIRQLLNTNQAEQAYEKASAYAETNPNSAEAQYWLGSTAGSMAGSASMFSALSYAKETKRAFQKAADLDVTHIEARMGLVQFHLQAPGIAGGDEAQVPLLIAQIKAINPGAGFRAEGSLKQDQKDEAGALALYLQALKIDAADGDALGQALGILATGKRFAEAAVHLQAALAKAPTSVKVRYQAGKYAALSGQNLESGLAHLDNIIALKPSSEDVPLAGAYWRRGQILERLGRKPEAIAAMEAALKISDMKQIKADLARIRKG